MKDFLFAPGSSAARRSVPVRRRARAADAGPRAGEAPPTCSCWTSRPTTSTSRRSTCRGAAGRLSGTVLLVSHDRDFLDRVVSAVLISDGDGVWTEFAGGYSDDAGAARARRRRQGRGWWRKLLPRPRSRLPPRRPRPHRGASSPSTRSTRWRRCRARSMRCRPKRPSSMRCRRRSLHARSEAIRQGDGAARRGDAGDR